MEKRQTAGLLAEASMIDNRVVTTETIEAWHRVIGHVDYQDAREALARHRRDSLDYLVPGHITAGVRRIQVEREQHERRTRPAIEANRITLNRAEFDRLTDEFTEQYRAERAADA